MPNVAISQLKIKKPVIDFVLEMCLNVCHLIRKVVLDTFSKIKASDNSLTSNSTYCRFVCLPIMEYLILVFPFQKVKFSIGKQQSSIVSCLLCADVD